MEGLGGGLSLHVGGILGEGWELGRGWGWGVGEGGRVSNWNGRERGSLGLPVSSQEVISEKQKSPAHL